MLIRQISQLSSQIAVWVFCAYRCLAVLWISTLKTTVENTTKMFNLSTGHPFFNSWPPESLVWHQNNNHTIVHSAMAWAERISTITYGIIPRVTNKYGMVWQKAKCDGDFRFIIVLYVKRRTKDKLENYKKTTASIWN